MPSQRIYWPELATEPSRVLEPRIWVYSSRVLNTVAPPCVRGNSPPLEGFGNGWLLRRRWRCGRLSIERLNAATDTAADDAADDALAHRLAGHALECRGVEPLALLGDVGRIPLLAALRALGDGFLAGCFADLAQRAACTSGS